ncbi:MAG: N-formylglutamate amidohydrolase [Acidimicrobiales bacterium]
MVPDPGHGVLVREPAGWRRPLVASIPHGSDVVPGRYAAAMLASEGLGVDAYTGEIYGFAAELGATVVEAVLSRFVADANRDADGPAFGPFPTAIVASTDGWRPLYDAELPAHAVEERVSVAHTAYHDALDAAVAAHLRAAPRTLLLDLHSFGVPLDADVILGDGRGSTAGEWVVAALEESLRAEGFRVARNVRFTGGWIVRRFAGEARVDAVQVELNKRCYADTQAVAQRRRPLPRDPQRIAEVRERIRGAFLRVLDEYEARAS